MVKTQVQIPDHLYNEAKRVSRDYEMSFAEVVRRGLEQLLPKYPPAAKPSVKWTPPILSGGHGYRELSPERLKELAQTPEFEARLMRAAAPKKRSR
jgi:hypothetical protein